MKKLLSILLVLAMIFSFAACGETKEENLPAYSQGLSKNGMYDLKALDYVTLPEYKGVDFGEDFWTVDPADIDTQIESLKSYFAETKQVTDRAIVLGDQVNIDYEGKLDGVAFDGGTAAGQTVAAGSAEFIDNMLDSLIGRTPGETYDVDATFPDPYPNNEEMSGKTAVFTIKINYISETEEPEITDEFVAEKLKEFYDVETVAELREYVEENLLKNSQAGIIDKYLYENAEVSEIPEAVYAHQRKAIAKNYEDSSASYGLDVDTLVSYYGYETLEELLDNSTDEINEMAKDALIYQAVAEDMGLKISNSDVADYFEESNGSREYESFQSVYGLPYLKFIAMTNKVVTAIRESAVK